jgi:DNA-directed RNA polymerase specialized sigma24 family protein
MNHTDAMTPRTQLGTQLRDVVVQHVNVHNVTYDDLATALQVRVEAVESLMTKQQWDLELALQLVSELGVRFRVVQG